MAPLVAGVDELVDERVVEEEIEEVPLLIPKST